jgi:hypothetical protein
MEGLSRMEVGEEKFRERVARKNVNKGKHETFQAEVVEVSIAGVRRRRRKNIKRL